MNAFKQAFRTLFKKGRGNLIKVLSLGTGLTIGIVLIAKVCFESSFDSFYPNSERIYQIVSHFSSPENPDTEYRKVSGAIAPGFQEYVPGIIYGTRITPLGNNSEDVVFYTGDHRKFKGNIMLADTNFFRVFNRPILIGDPVEILSEPRHALVSRSMSERMGGMESVVGTTFLRDDIPGVTFYIDGVFEDFPENGIHRFDIVVSLDTYRKESRENWMGNDRYYGYVLLAENTEPYSDQMKQSIRRMQVLKQEIDKVETPESTLWYQLLPFSSLHASDPDVKGMNLLLSLLAFALIFTAVMNYVLIVISSLVRRTKEVGVRKCYGALGRNIRTILLCETLIDLTASLMISAVLILSLRRMIEGLLGASLGAIFMPQTLIVIALVCIIVFLLSALLPSLLFERIPVATVFRNYKESKRRWKLVLLFFQFTATAFLFTLLLIIGKQYQMMAGKDPGYDARNVVFCPVTGLTIQEVDPAVQELKTLPIVVNAGSTSTLPIYTIHGNNVRKIDDLMNDLFNIADFYWASPEYYEIMGFKFIEGSAPVHHRDVAVSRSFVEKMKILGGWDGPAVGEPILITQHNNSFNEDFTVCTDPLTVSGVYEDFLIGSLQNQDRRPGAMFANEGAYNSSINFIVIKLTSLTNENVKRVYDTLKESFPEKDVEILSLQDEIVNLYSDSRKFRDSVLIGGIVTLLISLLGLIGYIRDETTRRSAEIAVRKINGAIVPEILSLFIRDILKISLPAIIAGNIATIFVARRWMEQFSEKITLSPWIFLISSVFVLVTILGVVVINCLRISNSNPVESLKNE